MRLTNLSTIASYINKSRLAVRRLISTSILVFFIIGMLVAFAARAGAQEQSPKNEPPPASTAPTSLDDELDKLRKRLTQLSTEVDRMRAEIAKLDKYRQIDYTRDQMLREEDRIRTLQRELVELGTREAPLRKRLDEIEAQQSPDRIERSLAGVGSTKPEEIRDSISRQLSIEKRQTQAQLDTIQASRTRNQSFITSAEESIARLKRRLIELSNDRSR